MRKHQKQWFLPANSVQSTQALSGQNTDPESRFYFEINKTCLFCFFNVVGGYDDGCFSTFIGKGCEIIPDSKKIIEINVCKLRPLFNSSTFMGTEQIL